MIEATETTYRQILKSSPNTLVVVSSSWCVPCKQMYPRIKQLEETSRNLTVVKVDIDRCPQITKDLKVTTVPTMVLMRAGGEVKRRVGTLSLPNLQKFVE